MPTTSLTSTQADSDALGSREQEHAEPLGGLAARTDAPTAVQHAGAVQALCETHVAKGNELLLPALAAAPGTSLAQLSTDSQALHEQHEPRRDLAPATPSTEEQPHGHTCSCHDDGGEPELDARTIPHAIRHAAIFGALDAVAPTANLILVAPHDPLPLLDQIGQRSPGAFDIEYLQRGPDAWRLRFTRTPAAPGVR